MLDQVKSGTSARIAASTRTGGANAPGPGVAVSRRVNPAPGGAGTDNDQGGGGQTPHRHAEDAPPRSQDLSHPPEEGLSGASAAPKVGPEAPVPRRKADAALRELLREARDLTPEPPAAETGDDPAAARPDPGQDPPPDALFTAGWSERAVRLYTRVERVGGKSEKPRPGVVFSATL